MRLQNTTLVAAGILAVLVQPLMAQTNPATTLNTVHSQVSQTQAAPSSPVQPAAPAATPAKPAVSTKPAASAKPEAASTKPAAKGKAEASAKPAASVKPVALAPAAPVTSAPSASAQAAPKPGAPAGNEPKRDPFSPLLSGNTGGGGATPDRLPPGKAGLMVGTLRIDGLIHGPNGMIAVVSNPQQRVYFLKEGDRIFDGQVLRITMEAVAFQQTGRDAFGNSLDHEVTRRLYPTPGEQR